MSALSEDGRPTFAHARHAGYNHGMSEPMNRMKCDCLDCQNWSQHVITTVLEGQIRERYMCSEHFKFLCSVYPQMVKDGPLAELPLTSAIFESFMRGEEKP